MRERMWKALGLGLVSAALSSLVIIAFLWIHNQTFPSAELLKHLLWYWAPGALFGLLFAGARMRALPKVLLYALVSSAIYFGAVQIAEQLYNPSPVNGSGNPWIAGLLAGLFGALALAIVTWLFLRISPGAIVLTAIVGAVAGGVFIVAFVWSLFFVGAFLAWALWQIPVSWALTWGLPAATGEAPAPVLPMSGQTESRSDQVDAVAQ